MGLLYERSTLAVVGFIAAAELMTLLAFGFLHAGSRRAPRPDGG